MKALAKFLEKYAGKLGDDHLKALSEYGGSVKESMRKKQLFDDIINVSKLSKHDQKYMKDIWHPDVLRQVKEEISVWKPRKEIISKDMGTFDKLIHFISKEPKKKIEPWEID